MEPPRGVLRGVVRTVLGAAEAVPGNLLLILRIVRRFMKDTPM